MTNEGDNEISYLETEIAHLKLDIEKLQQNYRERTQKIRITAFVSLFLSAGVMFFILFRILYNREILYNNGISTALVDINTIDYYVIVGAILLVPLLTVLFSINIKIRDELGKTNIEVNFYKNKIENAKNSIARIVKTKKYAEVSELALETAGRQGIVQEPTHWGGPYRDPADNDKLAISINDLLLDCTNSRKRLLTEIDSIKNRGRQSLSLGSGLSVIGIFILAATLFSTQPNIGKNFTDPQNVYPFLTRLTTLIFIEVFSFFFLRLYRNGLSEIKYYQNELTNLEAKFLALKSALHIDQTELKTQVVQDLIKIERNPLVTTAQSSLIDRFIKSENKQDHLFIDGFNSALDTVARFMGKKDAEEAEPKSKIPM